MDQILQILVQNGYIDDDSAKDLQDLAKTESKTVRQLVIDQEILSEDDLLAAMAAFFLRRSSSSAARLAARSAFWAIFRASASFCWSAASFMLRIQPHHFWR